MASQARDLIIYDLILGELFEEADVILVIIANIVDALENHGDALDAHAKGVTRVDLGIDAHGFEDFRINHAATHNFEPLIAELT